LEFSYNKNSTTDSAHNMHDGRTLGYNRIENRVVSSSMEDSIFHHHGLNEHNRNDLVTQALDDILNDADDSREGSHGFASENLLFRFPLHSK
jgi:hypothetical protein